MAWEAACDFRWVIQELYRFNGLLTPSSFPLRGQSLSCSHEAPGPVKTSWAAF
jgi:hypothetical protein